jgi:hypothetical protein
LARVVLGFTGARKGMTAAQFATFAARLHARPPNLFVHGSAFGADQQAHFVALAAGVHIRLRPCSIEAARAPCPGAVEEMPDRPPLLRNVDIVDDCTVLVACPSGPEHARSGTWATVRYAREVGRQIVIVWPDGRAVRDGVG